MSEHDDQHIQAFGVGAPARDADAASAQALGARGHDLAALTALGLPVPAGVTLGVEACAALRGGWSPGLRARFEAALDDLEARAGRRLDADDDAPPLLLVVRWSAQGREPPPALLGVGLSGVAVERLVQRRGWSPATGYAVLLRYLRRFGQRVHGASRVCFDGALDDLKAERGVWRLDDLDVDGWRAVEPRLCAAILAATGRPLEACSRERLLAALEAGCRAHGVGPLAAHVQVMVDGLGTRSGVGVARTRDPKTGAPGLSGEFLAAGDGVIFDEGLAPTWPLGRAGGAAEGGAAEGGAAEGGAAEGGAAEGGAAEGGAAEACFEAALDAAHGQLVALASDLERRRRQALELRFAVEDGALWVLGARALRASPAAQVRVAVDMVGEGLIEAREALLRVDPETVERLIHPAVDASERVVLARGLPASPGVVSGRVIFDAREAERRAARGEAIILVRNETRPEDLRAIQVIAGLLTARGGLTSHAAVIARGLGKGCVVGVSAMSVNEVTATLHVGGHALGADTEITLDGKSGEVWLGAVDRPERQTPRELETLLAWADGHRRLGVRANVDLARDARLALAMGAEGVGLCRTEHMFLNAQRLTAIQVVILASDDEAEARDAALAELEARQRRDFLALFSALGARPITLRLLDLPLTEFLPSREPDLQAVAARLGCPSGELRARASALSGFHPMLGHRGCRIGLTRPELYAMQTRAILEAACDVRGPAPRVEVMYPMVSGVEELDALCEQFDAVRAEVEARRGQRVDACVGTMIELPAACLDAGLLARRAAFFSFGSNDLTQTALGISRDDMAHFLPAYIARGLFAHDPFTRLETRRVGELMRVAIARGRQARPDLTLGLCGEHGGEPFSVAFCHHLGLDHVSCSPYRVPVARLAAAQAALGKYEECFR